MSKVSLKGIERELASFAKHGKDVILVDVPSKDSAPNPKLQGLADQSHGDFDGDAFGFNGDFDGDVPKPVLRTVSATPIDVANHLIVSQGYAKEMGWSEGDTVDTPKPDERFGSCVFVTDFGTDLSKSKIERVLPDEEFSKLAEMTNKVSVDEARLQQDRVIVDFPG